MPRSPGQQVMVPTLDLAVKSLSGTRGQEKEPLSAGHFGGCHPAGEPAGAWEEISG